MDADPITTSYLSIVTYSLLAMIATALIAAHYYIETSRAIRLIKRLPSPPSVPIVGHGLIPLKMLPENIVKESLKYYKLYGTVVGVHLGTKAVVFLADPQDIEIILSSPVHIDKAIEYQMFKPWLGDGLLITKGDKWRRHRKNSKDLVKRLRGKVGMEFDCHDYLATITVEILTETVMGIKKEKRKKAEFDYAIAVMKMSDIIHRRHYDISLRWNVLFKFSKFAKAQKKLLNIIHSFTEHIIKEKSRDVEEKLMTNQQQKEVQNDKSLTKCSNTTESMENKNAKHNAANYMHYLRDDLDDILMKTT